MFTTKRAIAVRTIATIPNTLTISVAPFRIRIFLKRNIPVRDTKKGAEMEKEQIIKALECCTRSGCSDNETKDCPLKPYEDCSTRLATDALALIKEQGEQIFKLENGVAECINVYSQTLAIERAKVKELSEINYKSAVTLIKEHYKTVESVVILFRDRLRERIKGVYLDEAEMCAIVDEVAGKILNGNTEEK